MGHIGFGFAAAAREDLELNVLATQAGKTIPA
jgi:hypothetical protein